MSELVTLNTNQITPNTILSAKNMHIIGHADENCRVDDTHADRAMRNLYAEVINVAIRDLRRGLDLEAVGLKYKTKKARRVAVKNARLNRYLAISWFRNGYECDVTFELCCEVLNLHKAYVIRNLIAQGLLEPEIEKTDSIPDGYVPIQ